MLYCDAGAHIQQCTRMDGDIGLGGHNVPDDGLTCFQLMLLVQSLLWFATAVM